MKSAHRNSPFANNGANTNTATQNTKQQEAKKVPRRIVNNNPTPIKESATVSTEWSTTNKLAKQINTIMKVAFEDYYGTLIGVNQQTGEIGATLMFRPVAVSSGSEDKRAFLPVADRVVEAGGNRLEAAISMVNQAQMKSSNFELSAYGAELLYDLVLPQFRGKIDPFNPKTYKNFISEVTRGNQFGFMSNGTVYCSINIIDIAKLITLVHGEKDEDNDSQVVYNVGVVRPMVTDAAGNTKNWVISITGMSRASLEKTMNELGAIMSDGDFVITGTM